jgi:MFS family permease
MNKNLKTDPHMQITSATQKHAPSKLRLLLIYTFFGPLLGWLFFFLAFNLVQVIPDLIKDPHNQFGHHRWFEYFSTLAFMLLFSYPIGILPALVSGVSHALLRQHFQTRRLYCIGLIGLAGAVTAATGLTLLPVKLDRSLYLILISALCATILSIYCSRTHLRNDDQA